MNAFSPIADFQSVYLDAVIARYGFNLDSSAAHEQALRNLASGQPAFWTKAGSGHVGANLLRDAANAHVGIDAGIAAIEPHNRATIEWLDLHTVAALDTLVPLNDAATEDLQAAYEIAGTFRSKAELTKRARVDPDTEAMITAPAATVAGSVSLLDAVRSAKVA